MAWVFKDDARNLVGKYPQMAFHPGEREDNSQVTMGARWENGGWTTKPAKKSSSAGNKSVAANVANDGAQQRAAEERQGRINALNNQKGLQRGLLKNSLDLQAGEARKRSDESLKEMYISYMRGAKGLPQQTAMWGAGGAIESLKNKGQLNYENNRAKENQTYSSVMSKLQQKYNDELMSLEEKYLSRLMNL